jgi:hypothetical protein
MLSGRGFSFVIYPEKINAILSLLFITAIPVMIETQKILTFLLRYAKHKIYHKII